MPVYNTIKLFLFFQNIEILLLMFYNKLNILHHVHGFKRHWKLWHLEGKTISLYWMDVNFIHYLMYLRELRKSTKQIHINSPQQFNLNLN